MSDSTQSMFFKSEGVDAHWDTWMYFHEGTYYLFYLITDYSPGEGLRACHFTRRRHLDRSRLGHKGVGQNGHLPRHRRRLEVTRLRQ